MNWHPSCRDVYGLIAVVSLPLLILFLLPACGPKSPSGETPTTPPILPARENSRVAVRDGHLWVDGERFLVRGIGYEPGTRPGQYPWSRKFEPEILKFDFKRIKEAGFNTLRSWSGYSDEELSLMEEEGLWVIQGIWVDREGDFGDSDFVKKALRDVEKVVKSSSRHQNILMYLVMNEPGSEPILKAGEEPTGKLMELLRKRIHELHPGTPVAFANTGWGDFFDVPSLDGVVFNLYMYSPATLRDVLGYRAYIEWLKRESASSRPLVVAEYGLSVSKQGEGRFGYGGNSLQEQAQGDLWMFQSMIQGGADGGCVFAYADGWWKNNDEPNDANVHDDHPEEWYGLVGLEQFNDREGTPRPAWDAYSKANRAVWTEPVSWKQYRDKLSFEVYTTDDVLGVAVQTESGRRLELTKDAHWWRGELSCLGLKAAEKVTLVVRTKAMGVLEQSRTIVTDWSGVAEELRPVEFSIGSMPEHLVVRQKIRVTLQATSAEGGAVANRRFKIGIYPHEGWDPGMAYEVTSDKDGRISVIIDPPQSSGYITLSVSTGHEPLKDLPTWGNAFQLEILKQVNL